MPATTPYIYLILSWIFFGATHSLLAADFIKRLAMKRMKQYYKYYRLLYSLFATGALWMIVYYHVAYKYLLLWQPPLIQTILSEMLIVTGVVVMFISARKYFMDLSGINSALGISKQYPLQTTGMNAYVRHPLYSGTLLLVWAFFFRYTYLSNLVSCICVTLYTWIGMYLEEKKLVELYGEDYRLYQERVSGLIPGFPKYKT